MAITQRTLWKERCSRCGRYGLPTSSMTLWQPGGDMKICICVHICICICDKDKDIRIALATRRCNTDVRKSMFWKTKRQKIDTKCGGQCFSPHENTYLSITIVHFWLSGLRGVRTAKLNIPLLLWWSLMWKEGEFLFLFWSFKLWGLRARAGVLDWKVHMVAFWMGHGIDFFEKRARKGVKGGQGSNP